MSDERQAYTPADAIYTKTGKRSALRQTSTRTEARIGMLLVGGGIIWAAYAAKADYSTLWQLGMHGPGPLGLCGIGILVWLHAKWRRSIQPK